MHFLHFFDIQIDVAPSFEEIGEKSTAFFGAEFNGLSNGINGFKINQSIKKL